MSRPSISEAIQQIVPLHPKGADSVTVDLRAGLFPGRDGKPQLQVVDGGPIRIRLAGQILPRPELKLIQRNTLDGKEGAAIFKDFDALAKEAFDHPCRGWRVADEYQQLGNPTKGTLLSRDTDLLGRRLFDKEGAPHTFKLEWEIPHGRNLDDAIATLTVTKRATGVTETWSGTKVDEL